MIEENKITGLHHIGTIRDAMKGLENHHMKVQRKDLLSGAAPFVLNGLHQKMVYEIIPVTSMIEILNQVYVDKQCQKPIVVMGPNGTVHIVKQDSNQHLCAKSTPSEFMGKTLVDISFTKHSTMEETFKKEILLVSS